MTETTTENRAETFADNPTPAHGWPNGRQKSR